MNLKWPVLTAAFAFLAGCGAPGGGPSLDHADLHPELLRSTLLSEAPAIGIPARLQVADGVLWIGDARRDPSLHVLDSSTGELLHSFARRGEGPGDFALHPWALALDPNNPRAIWAFDPPFQRLTRFEPLPASEYELSMIHLEGNPRVGHVVRVGAARFIGVVQSVEARFALFSADGTRIGVAPGLLNGPEDAPDRWRWAATNGAIAVCSWPGRGFVIANHGFGRLELYDTDARLVRYASVPFPSEPIFDDQGRYLLRAGYLGCTATPDHVYALFPGENSAPSANPDELTAMRSQSGTFVHVFDWSGELRAAFQLDRDAGAITITRAGDILYTGSFVDSAIYRYQVPPLAIHSNVDGTINR